MFGFKVVRCLPVVPAAFKQSCAVQSQDRFTFQKHHYLRLRTDSMLACQNEEQLDMPHQRCLLLSYAGQKDRKLNPKRQDWLIFLFAATENPRICALNRLLRSSRQTSRT